MKPILEKISLIEHDSFYIKDLEQAYFSSPWHFHPEIEIILIVSGYGVRYVGDSIKNFYPGDLVITGSNTPHFWSCSSEFYNDNSNLSARAIFIQFADTFWGKTFSELPELYKVMNLLNESKRGIRFKGNSRAQIEKHMVDLSSQSGLTRLVKLLTILELMASSQDYTYLSSPNYKPVSINSEDEHRMEIIYNHVMRNYKREIPLKEISDMMNLTPQSFCRYFKSRYNKVFSSFVNEVRIGNASKLLIENNLNVTQICYESGFNHLSNFNRQFKKLKNMTPSEYQRKYWNQTLDQINDK